MSNLQAPPMNTTFQDSIKIVTAPWIVPVDSPTLRNGAVAVCNGRILCVGKRVDVLSSYPDCQELQYDCVLLPGLINGHMHLELSHLRNISSPLPEETFTDWIEALLLQRLKGNFSKTDIVESFSQVLQDQYNSGVALVADIGNEYFSELHVGREENWPIVLRMLEFLGPHDAAFQAAQASLRELENEIPATAHAPYSTVPRLLVVLKRRSNRLHHIFSVHTAETKDEFTFLSDQKGCFRDFLEKRESWDTTFFNGYDGGSGTIHYYKQLDILDERTLLVHCVHVTDDELQLVKKQKSSICLCPGSNAFLNVGVAPVVNMIAAGILPALGTDSFASNREIDLWREMAILSEQHPQISADTILAMATLGGASALHCSADYGSLSSGKSAHFFHAASPALRNCNNVKELERELVSGGRPSEISWVDTVHSSMITEME